MPHLSRYQTLSIKFNYTPNLWDIVVFLIILALFSVLAWGANQMSVPYQIGETLTISLDPWCLPGYAVRTIIRMLFALVLSLLFTFIVAPIAAKNKKAGRLIIPAIDILQSIPVLGILSITVVAFINLFPNSLLGAECAAIFAIFTSQVWNITLGFYQSMISVPKEFYEAADAFHLNFWQRFWRVDVPYSMPSLLWNTMASMSAGWFFVVASEAISVSNQNIWLPGIGSYIREAIVQADIHAVFYAIAAMFIVILFYDQLMFRPLLAWTEHFTSDRQEDHYKKPWFYRYLIKRLWFQYCLEGLYRIKDYFINARFLPKMHFRSQQPSTPAKPRISVITEWLWNVSLVIGIIFALLALINFITQTISFQEINRVFYLGGITTLKITVLIIVASLLWVPIGVWIGISPKLRAFFQPATQFVAAFPVNLIYPIIVTLIVEKNLNVEIWSTPLMILGTQWYILFNVIAGASAIPKKLQLTVKNLGVKRLLWWKKFILPAIFPYYITGATTAAAGCWNASIVADSLSWGEHNLTATGLGSYITEYTTFGDFPRIALGISVMCIYVIIINRLVWHKLYQLATKRFIMEQ
jgi:NitT/TauT family transport system permease protein